MEGTQTFGPMEIWNSMGTVGHLVLFFLLLMSIYSIAVMIDRYILFTKARNQSLHFVAAAKEMLDAGRLEDVVATAKKYPKSHIARIYASAIQDFNVYRGEQLVEGDFEDTMRGAMEREAVQVTQDFKRGLSGLASIGATAPFVGLFGTVVGIMNAFFAMARAGAGGVGTVAGGIAEALVNTAVGLFVALPAVWGFNYFLGRMERLSAEMSNASSELVDYFIKRTRKEAWHTTRGQART
jgi:biopolymer transport protein ExbB/biopolymer transport protein TolQ